MSAPHPDEARRLTRSLNASLTTAMNDQEQSAPALARVLDFAHSSSLATASSRFPSSSEATVDSGSPGATASAFKQPCGYLWSGWLPRWLICPHQRRRSTVHVASAARVDSPLSSRDSGHVP
jgi:hypothetical protein